jgi:hypothetical protein
LESISSGIDLYDKTIIVCSTESLSESWWVDRELDRILKKERDLFKQNKKHIHILVPITIDDFVFKWDGSKSEEIRRYLIGDFREWENDQRFELAVSNLITALNVDRPQLKPPSYL